MDCCLGKLPVMEEEKKRKEVGVRMNCAVCVYKWASLDRSSHN